MVNDRNVPRVGGRGLGKAGTIDIIDAEFCTLHQIIDRINPDSAADNCAKDIRLAKKVAKEFVQLLRGERQSSTVKEYITPLRQHRARKSDIAEHFQQMILRLQEQNLMLSDLVKSKDEQLARILDQIDFSEE